MVKGKKGEEVIVNLQAGFSTYCAYLHLFWNSIDSIHYFNQLYFLNPRHRLYREEFQRWTDVYIGTNEKLILTKCEIGRNYAIYKIQFGKDEKFKRLANEILSNGEEFNFMVDNYDGVTDLQLLKKTRVESVSKIAEFGENVLDTRRQKVIDYLDDEVLKLANRL